MGYDIIFTCSFDLDHPLSSVQITYLKTFTETWSMGRDAKLIKELENPLREAVGLPVDDESEYYV